MNERGCTGKAIGRLRAYRLSSVLMVLVGTVSVSHAATIPSSASSPSQETTAPSDTLAETIEYLLAYVEQSKLTFIRNGNEHDSRAAAAHLRRKYEYVQAGIATPEDFIEKVASKSFLSGKPYLVRLPGGREVPVETWLRGVLKDLQH